MEDHSIGGTPKDFFKKIKDVTGKYTAKVGTVKSADGKDLTEDAQIENVGRNMWKSYVKETKDVVTLLYIRSMNMNQKF